MTLQSPGRATADAPRTSLLVSLGHFLFRFRDGLVPVLVIGLLLSSRSGDYLGSERFGRWLDVAGLLVATTGQLLRAVVIGLVYIVRGGRNRTIYADRLVVEGFFAHSRNPLYLGNLLVLLGLFLILNTGAGYLVGVPLAIILYSAIIAAEESHLAAQFGADYEEYRRTVPRLFPRRRGIGRTFRSMSFDWRRLLRSEYGATFAWTSTAIAMLATERLQRHGWADSRAQFALLAGVWGGLLLCYGTVRFLKKSAAPRQRVRPGGPWAVRDPGERRSRS